MYPLGWLWGCVDRLYPDPARMRQKDQKSVPAPGEAPTPAPPCQVPSSFGGCLSPPHPSLTSTLTGQCGWPTASWNSSRETSEAG